MAGDTTEMSETEGELSDNESEQQDGDKDINEAATETEDEAGEGTMEEENLGKVLGTRGNRMKDHIFKQIFIEMRWLIHWLLGNFNDILDE